MEQRVEGADGEGSTLGGKLAGKKGPHHLKPGTGVRLLPTAQTQQSFQDPGSDATNATHETYQ
jgi:hypothetical protein